MKKFLIFLGVLAIIVIGSFLKFKSVYNKLVIADEGTKKMFSQIETVLQRRFDLIPNLVSTVKGYAEHEKEVFQGIAEARASVGKVTMDMSKVIGNKDMMAQYAKSQSTLGGALQKLLMVQERYPDLKADKQFLNLQHELSGSENRISVARQRYNDAVGEINTMRRFMIARMIAGMMGIEEHVYYKADEGAQSAPTVNF